MSEIKFEKIKGHIYSKEEVNFLKNNCVGRTCNELTELFNKHFGLSLTISQITCKKKNLKLKNGVVTRFQKDKGSYPRGIKYQHQFTKEQIQFLKDNVKLPNFLVTEKFNEKFKTSLTVRKIYSAKCRHKIKGCVVYGSKYITGFQKGNIPPRLKPLGSERISKDGFVEIKIRDGTLSRNYVSKHRLIYEQNFGKIPKGYCVSFLDGNTLNFELSNLFLISRAEHARLNQDKLRSSNPDITKTGYLIAKLKTQIYNRKS